MARTKTARTLVASVSKAAASADVFGTIDLEATDGGTVTIKITNGATGPTAQCAVNILIAHNATLPAAAAAGADWKTLYTGIGGGSANNAVTEMSYPIDASVMALEVQFTGNTGQAVTVEAFISELTSAV